MGAGAATRRTRRGLTGRREAAAADRGSPGEAAPPGGAVARRHSGLRRGLTLAACAAACVAGGAALLVIYLRASLSMPVGSDGANSALQAWSLLHGNLDLHGWYIGDANYYFFELPVNALTQALFGLGDYAAHVASACVYLIVTIFAVAVAIGDSRGIARLARGAVVLAVLTVPLLDVSGYNVQALLGEPDHIGTMAFILAAILVIDRMPERRLAAPLLCLILAAGQFSDMTVRYIAVPAVVLVCGVRVLAARRLRSPDGALAAAAVVSVPVAALFATLLAHLGGFRAYAPEVGFSAPGRWPHRAQVAWLAVRRLFSAVGAGDVRHGVLGEAFGWACLLAVAAGLLAVVAGLAWAAWAKARRRPNLAGDRAGRAVQLLAAVIAANLATYVVSAIVRFHPGHEILSVLPCGAALAARTLVPARIPRLPARIPRLAAAPVAAAVALTVLLPLASAATLPPYPEAPTAPLTAWLAAVGLHDGLGAYGDSSASTLQTGGAVTIRTVYAGDMLFAPHYESDTAWYDPAAHDATFAVAGAGLRPAEIRQAFGEPAAIFRLSHWVVMVYGFNLLARLQRVAVARPAPCATAWPKTCG